MKAFILLIMTITLLPTYIRGALSSSKRDIKSQIATIAVINEVSNNEGFDVKDLTRGTLVFGFIATTYHIIFYFASGFSIDIFWIQVVVAFLCVASIHALVEMNIFLKTLTIRKMGFLPKLMSKVALIYVIYFYYYIIITEINNDIKTALMWSTILLVMLFVHSIAKMNKKNI